jgi:hypothetical protein
MPRDDAIISDTDKMSTIFSSKAIKLPVSHMDIKEHPKARGELATIGKLEADTRRRSDIRSCRAEGQDAVY